MPLTSYAILLKVSLRSLDYVVTALLKTAATSDVILVQKLTPGMRDGLTAYRSSDRG